MNKSDKKQYAIIFTVLILTSILDSIFSNGSGFFLSLTIVAGTLVTCIYLQVKIVNACLLYEDDDKVKFKRTCAKGSILLWCFVLFIVVFNLGALLSIFK